MNSTSQNVTAYMRQCHKIFSITMRDTITFGSVCGGIVILGILGNLFVIWVIVRDSKFHRCLMNIMLLNLAIADCSNLITCSPDLIQVLNSRGWIYPAILCPLVRYLQVLFLYNSLITQVVICIERYLAICTPLHVNRFSHKTVLIIIASSWIFSAIFAAPYGLLNRCYTVCGNIRICYVIKATSYRNFWRFFKYSEVLALYFLPLGIIIALYLRMGRVLWGRSSMRMLYQHQLTKYLAVLRVRRSVIKMLFICILVYFICYSPPQVFFILGLFIRLRPPATLRLTINSLTLASSAANPIVYTICYERFRRKLKLLFTCNRRCRGSAGCGSNLDSEKGIVVRDLGTAVPFQSQRKSTNIRRSLVLLVDQSNLVVCDTSPAASHEADTFL